MALVSFEVDHNLLEQTILRMNFTKSISDFLDIFYPNICPGCNEAEKPEESIFCVRCTYRLPYSKTLLNENQNELIKKFDPALDIHHAVALFTMDDNSIIEQLIRQIKYHHRRFLGAEAGKAFGHKIISQHLLRDIDVLLPVPLHKKKLHKRGYNQSLKICEGISSVLQIPIDTFSLIRIKHTKTQTAMSKLKRVENMSRAFSLQSDQNLRDKHVCIVDDVITTGSTVTACLEQMKSIQGIRFSVACIGLPIDF